jgi:hypothetical protein
MATDTRVELRRNDGSEVFNLKTTRVETEVSNGLVTDSIISGVSRKLLGGKFVLDLRTFQVDVDIQGMEPDDYPNSGMYDGSSPDYPDHDDYGFRWELERAALEWGWTSGDGFDQLYYDGRTFNGVITNLSLTEDTEAGKARTYTGTLEVTYLDEWVS